MGCKQVAVTLPPVLLAFDRVFLARSWRELFRERRLPWAALFVTWLVIAVRPAVQGAFLTDTSTGIGFTITAVTPTQYLFTQSEVILHYVRLSVLPLHQALDYIDWPIAHSVRDVLPAFLAVSALLAGSLALLYFRPVAGFVGFWFFAILAPTSSLMPIIDPVFEQRMYLPLISVVVAAVFGAHALIARTGWPEHTKARAGAAALGVTAVVLTALTVLRNETYRSEMVAWQTAAKARPNNARAWMSVGAMYLNAGDLKGASEALKIAQEHADPTNFTFQATLAGYWAAAGDLEKAEGIYAGLAKVPYNPFVSPRVYKNLAWILLARGKPDEAAAWLRKLIEYQPHVADNYLNLAAAELAAGHETEAREAAKKAAELNPALPQLAAAQARANVLVPEGGALAFRKPQALWVAAAACLADGDRDPQMLDTLAMAYAWHERYPEAADAARRGLAAARAKGDEDWTAALEARLKLYEAGKPYTKPIPPK
jgi:tetratricopeptide (TPR) repeat protein